MDPPALAGALIRALETPSMGLAARARIVEDHSIGRVADRVLALYRALCPAPRHYFSMSPAVNAAVVATADLPSTARTAK